MVGILNLRKIYKGQQDTLVMAVDIDKLYRIALENSAAVKEWKKRSLYDELKKKLEAGGHKKPAILISGIRGVGKTTLMLQLFAEGHDTFYYSADSIAVKSTTIYSLVEQAYRAGYKNIFIDEIHKYPQWVEELKNIYDDFNAQIIASGSSVASIKKGSVLLGRRALDIPLHPLTFGEFLYFREGQYFQAAMEDVLDKKKMIRWLAEHPQVEKYYKEYLSIGGFPLKMEEKGAIFRLIRRMIYEDAIAEFSLTKIKVDAIEKLLSFLASSTPGEFSYTSFSSMSGYGKSTIYEAVQLLKELGIITTISEKTPKAKAKSTIKLLFAHPNLRVAFAEQLMQEPGTGALREEYFVFHAIQSGFPVFIPKAMKKAPDYEVAVGNRKLLFEIGGKSKTRAQLEGREGLAMNDEALMVLGFVQKTVQK